MNSFVYFISDGQGGLKIGYSVDPAARLQTLQTATSSRLSIIGAIPGNVRTERALHARFAAFRIENEWFRFDRLLMEQVEDLLNLFDPYNANLVNGDEDGRDEIDKIDEAALRRRLSEMLRARWPVKTDQALEKLGIAPARSVRNWLWHLSFPNGVSLLRLINVAGIAFLRELIADPSRELARAARAARRDALEVELAKLAREDADEDAALIVGVIP